MKMQTKWNENKKEKNKIKSNIHNSDSKLLLLLLDYLFVVNAMLAHVG